MDATEFLNGVIDKQFRSPPSFYKMLWCFILEGHNNNIPLDFDLEGFLARSTELFLGFWATSCSKSQRRDLKNKVTNAHAHSSFPLWCPCLPHRRENDSTFKYICHLIQGSLSGPSYAKQGESVLFHTWDRDFSPSFSSCLSLTLARSGCKRHPSGNSGRTCLRGTAFWQHSWKYRH